ncbi:MAG: SPOR domain-containing protein [Sphingomonadales bacterium]|jgi:hypothetical protein
MFGDDDKGEDVLPTPRKGNDRLLWLDEVPSNNDEGVVGNNKQRKLLISGSLAVTVLFASLLFYIYDKNNGGIELPESEVLLVHAPEGAIKIEPKDRGGLNIPDQDRVVFDTVTGEDSQNGENVQRGPEQPLERPAAKVSLGQNSNDNNGDQRTTLLPSAPSQTQTQLPEPLSIKGFSGKYMVQLGAFRSQAGAENAWNTISQRFGPVLSGLKPNYLSVQRTGEKLLFRLRSGPLVTLQEAGSVCDRLKAMAQACFVVTPQGE